VNILNSSHGLPIKGGPPAWGWGMELTHQEKTGGYEMLHRQQKRDTRLGTCNVR
jgi:hypothetical protein